MHRRWGNGLYLGNTACIMRESQSTKLKKRTVPGRWSSDTDWRRRTTSVHAPIGTSFQRCTWQCYPSVNSPTSKSTCPSWSTDVAQQQCMVEMSAPNTTSTRHKPLVTRSRSRRSRKKYLSVSEIMLKYCHCSITDLESKFLLHWKEGIPG